MIFNPTFTSGFLTVTRTTSCGSSNLTFFIQSSGGGGPLDPVFLRTGLDEVLDEEAELMIFPNPSFDGSIKISHKNQEILEISIMDFLGRKMKSILPSPETAETIVTGLPKGTYLVQFTNNKQIKVSHKIIIY